MSLLKDFTDLGNFYADKGGNRPYLEKRSNAYLDDFTRNAGSNNYTKFARDVNRWGQPGCQGQPWCAVYQFWKLVKIFGLKKALQIMGGGFYNCRSVTRHAKNNGTWKKTPKKGALVVFRNGTHIGSIINYNGSYIYVWINYGTSGESTSVDAASTLKRRPQYVGKVTAKELNVRSWADVESPVIKKWPLLREGNLVDICDTIKASDGSEWYYVRIAGKYYGFVATKYIKRQ